MSRERLLNVWIAQVQWRGSLGVDLERFEERPIADILALSGEVADAVKRAVVDDARCALRERTEPGLFENTGV